MIGDYNVFNIRSGSKWIGSYGSTRGFVDFNSLDHCVRAAWIIVCSTYRRRGVLTVSQIINTFAPPKENNTDVYIDFVCSRLSVFPFYIPSSKLEFANLLSAMSEYESGKSNKVSPAFILSVVDKFGLSVYKCSR